MTDFKPLVDGFQRFAASIREAVSAFQRMGDFMGMYTSVIGELAVQGDVVPFLRWWLSYPRGACPGFPKHDLFAGCTTEVEDPSCTGDTRWYQTLFGAGVHRRDDSLPNWPDAPANDYGEVLSHGEDSGDTLVVRVSSTLKNYGGELELFVDWITPYVREGWLETLYETAYHVTGYVFVNGVKRCYSVPDPDREDGDYSGWGHEP